MLNLIPIIAVWDAFLPFSYLIGSDPFAFHIASILLKVFLVLWQRKIYSIETVLSLLSVMLIMIFGSFLLELNQNLSLVEYSKYAAFTLSLALYIILLSSHEKIRRFCTTYFFASVFVALVYIVLAFTGKIPTHYGRYFYFGGSHHNLGGEISAMAAFLGVMFVDKRAYILSTLILLYASFLMQSRAAEIVIILFIVMKLVWIERDDKLNYRAIILFSLLTVMMDFLSGNYISQVFTNDILRLSDEYRGMDTGLVGRDERWMSAINLFLQYPLAGAGISYFESQGELSPHNAFLYGLAKHGLMSIFFWVFLFYMIFTARKVIKGFLVFILPLAILLLLNDRFINLNPYPGLFYAIVFSLAGVAIREARSLKQMRSIINCSPKQ